MRKHWEEVEDRIHDKSQLQDIRLFVIFLVVLVFT